MSKQAETFIDRMEHCVRSLHFTRHRIEKHIADMAQVREFMQHPEVLKLFDMLLKAIKDEAATIGYWDGADK